MINKELAEKISKDVEEALKVIEDKYNVSYESRGGSISDYEFDMKGRFTLRDREEDIFREKALEMGIDPELYNKSIKLNGKILTVVDINTRAQKYPLILKGKDGKRIKVEWSSRVESLVM